MLGALARGPVVALHLRQHLRDDLVLFTYLHLAAYPAVGRALLLNLIILLGIMAYMGAVMTLPGIAGLVLGVAMAVDANVLIYERIREELGKGKSLRGAIDAGYARAFGTIFDSHVTTLISSIILIFMGTGEIKGFGVTLTIGVAASLFTALVVTRLIFNFMMDRNLIKSLPMLHVIRSAKINFMKVATPLESVWPLVGASVLPEPVDAKASVRSKRAVRAIGERELQMKDQSPDPLARSQPRFACKLPRPRGV